MNDGYDEWYDYVRARPYVTGDDWTTRVAAALGVPNPGVTATPRVVGVSSADGITTTELAWDVGFGPELHAWFLHPQGVDPSTLPGVLDLHCHAGIKSIGAERLLPGPVGKAYQDMYEDGVAFAALLAARGVAVLAPDTFSWGSRRFDFSQAQGQLADLGTLLAGVGVGAWARGARRLDVSPRPRSTSRPSPAARPACWTGRSSSPHHACWERRRSLRRDPRRASRRPRPPRRPLLRRVA